MRAVLAVAEGVNDHENLGSLFRNAAALGVDGVLLGPRCADPLYRRSVRVSMGHVLRVPFAELPGEWPGSLDVLRAAGLTVAALTPAPDALPLAAAGLSGRAHGAAAGRRGPGAHATRRSPRRTCACGSRWRPVSTLSMSQRLPRWPSTR